MVAYFSGVLSSLLTTLFFVFLIAAVGYLIGGIEIKGISLGTAGVLLMALIYGIIANQIGSFTVGGNTIVLFDTDTVKPMYSLISNLGTAMFVTAVGLIAGPKFFRNFNRSSLSYILMGVIIIAVGVVITVVLKLLSGMSSSMAVGLMTGALTSTPGLSAAKDAAMDPDAVTAGYGIALPVRRIGRGILCAAGSEISPCQRGRGAPELCGCQRGPAGRPEPDPEKN